MYRYSANFFALLMFVSLCGASSAMAQATAAPVKQRVASRIFFQDDQTATIRWAEILADNQMKLGPIQSIGGFPKLDPQRQRLAHMEAGDGWLLVAVRDDEDGNFASGWVLIDTGVDEWVHGDHSHWYYRRKPQVRASVINGEQGNPAHVHFVDHAFYVANDQRDGITRLLPGEVSANESAESLIAKAKFHKAGGGHISVAVAGNTALATWIDREGEHSGQIDLLRFYPNQTTEPSLVSLKLPHGGLHGAAAHQNRFFVASVDGIYWFKDSPNLTAENFSPQRIDLGRTGEKPRRTGSFTTFGDYVTCVYGEADQAAVGLIRANSENATMHSIPLQAAEGSKLVGPIITKVHRSSPLAFVFHDQPEESTAPNRLSILQLDPDGNGDWQDAKVLETRDVGKSKMMNHGGHHGLDSDDNGVVAMFTNPGDSTIGLMTLADRKVQTLYRITGLVPSRIVLIGARGFTSY